MKSWLRPTMFGGVVWIAWGAFVLSMTSMVGHAAGPAKQAYSITPTIIVKSTETAVNSPDLAPTNYVLGVSTRLKNELWAVGYHYATNKITDRQTEYPLIEHWTGQQWQVMPDAFGTSIAGRLVRVVEVDQKNAWAIGNFKNGGAIEHWDGSRWSVILHSLNATLTSISAPEMNDISVVGSTNGKSSQPFHIHWNGHQWKS